MQIIHAQLSFNKISEHLYGLVYQTEINTTPTFLTLDTAEEVQIKLHQHTLEAEFELLQPTLL